MSLGFLGELFQSIYVYHVITVSSLFGGFILKVETLVKNATNVEFNKLVCFVEKTTSVSPESCLMSFMASTLRINVRSCASV